MRKGSRLPRRARNDIASGYDPTREQSADAAVQRRREAAARGRRTTARAIATDDARREWNRVGKRVAAEVFETFGRTCHLCGRPNSATTVDHIVPKSLGGSHALENCRPACASCNIGRGTRSVEEYRAYLREHGRTYDPNAVRSQPSRRWFG